jgi:hypothetical protein
METARRGEVLDCLCMQVRRCLILSGKIKLINVFSFNQLYFFVILIIGQLLKKVLILVSKINLGKGLYRKFLSNGRSLQI